MMYRPEEGKGLICSQSSIEKNIVTELENLLAIPLFPPQGSLFLMIKLVHRNPQNLNIHIYGCIKNVYYVYTYKNTYIHIHYTINSQKAAKEKDLSAAVATENRER